MRTLTHLVLISLVAASPLSAQPPGGRPSPWSAGVFAAYDSQPYRGAGEDFRAFPFAAYRGERFQWYGPFVQYAFLKQETWSLSAHAGVQFPPYEEDDADILEGMGDRSTTLVGGLDLEAELGNAWRMTLSLDRELFGAYEGHQASLGISRGIGSPRAPLSGSLGAGVLAQDDRWTDYHVGVPADRARADRPAYDPEASLHPFLSGRILWRFHGNWSALWMLRLEFLDDEWRDSPLIGDDTRLMGMWTVGYSF